MIILSLVRGLLVLCEGAPTHVAEIVHEHELIYGDAGDPPPWRRLRRQRLLGPLPPIHVGDRIEARQDLRSVLVGGFIKQRRSEVGKVQITAFERRLPDFCFSEVRALQLGDGEVRALQSGAAKKFAPCSWAKSEVCALQLGAAEVRAFQSGAAEVRALRLAAPRGIAGSVGRVPAGRLQLGEAEVRALQRAARARFAPCSPAQRRFAPCS